MEFLANIKTSPARKISGAVLGEFIGTFMFLLCGFIGAQSTVLYTRALDTDKPPPDIATLVPLRFLYIAFAFGLGLTVNVWVFYRVSGGMFNPAVTLGLVFVGAVSPRRALAIVPTQLLAGIAAAGVVASLLPSPLFITTILSPQTSVAQGVLLEMLFTAQLVLTVYLLAVEKHRATFLAPIGIGASLFVGHVASIGLTGASMNPARSFGPALLVNFPKYHWIYWVGPFAGALLAYIIYSTLKWLDYEAANPGQDDDNVERLPDRVAIVPRDGRKGSRSPAAELVFNIRDDEARIVDPPRT
ncbi:hypothetical protein HIM_06166 [Hirsutella minnesotensis 3608]|uniref:Aquaporin-1 n=1 Tax=Hirsutella minnesotensis 3608 TaxID=1043627 RepID=A0A0F7ZNY7_9HYPO|nr:hypothetical protein HIM_06166 [Hirsutella minnesotensis 3608]